MAIKRTKEKSTINIPAKLDKLLERGFTEQFMQSKFETLFKATKAQVVGYLESNTDGFDADLGKGFKCEQGTVIYQSRSNVQIDRDKLAALVHAGKITVEQLVACISTFKNEDLEKSLSSTVFNDIATKGSAESLTFRGSAEFKAEMEAKMGLPDDGAAEFKAELEKPAPAPVKEAKADPLAKAKAAAAKAKSKSKSADQDLDDILGE